VDDFTKLQPTEHMLKWLASNPYAAIRSQVESILREQVPGCQLKAFRVSSEPQWLTGAGRSDADPDIAFLVRTGVAFEFQLAVNEPNGVSHDLQGVFSWVGVNLNDPQKVQYRVWFDLGETLETMGSEGELMSRVYFA
jgi:hypothetical protein